MIPDEFDLLWWPEYWRKEHHCEACGVWLTHDHPSIYCDSCKSESKEPSGV